MTRLSALVCLLLSLFLSAEAALAAPNGIDTAAPVVVVTSHGYPEFVTRLRGYLRGSVWVLDDAEGPITTTDVTASAARAMIGLEPRPDSSSLAIHMLDVATSREIVREVPFEPMSGPSGESAAMEAAALIVSATLDEWYAEALAAAARAEASTAPASQPPPQELSPAQPKPPSPAKQTLPRTRVKPLPEPASEPYPLGVSVFYQGFVSGGALRHGPALELASLRRWFVGVSLGWSQGEWSARGPMNDELADVRVQAGSLALMVGPRLGLGADVWLTPALGAEISRLTRRTVSVADGLDATEDDTFTGAAARARLTIDGPGWCVIAQPTCVAQLRLSVAALTSVFARRPVWAVQSGSDRAPLDAQWGLLHPGAELGARVEF